MAELGCSFPRDIFYFYYLPKKVTFLEIGTVDLDILILILYLHLAAHY